MQEILLQRVREHAECGKAFLHIHMSVAHVSKMFLRFALRPGSARHLYVGGQSAGLISTSGDPFLKGLCHQFRIG